MKHANWNCDRFAAFRRVFEEFNDHCREFLIPDDLIAIDATLYPQRTSVAFKQYNPSKPSRYRLLFKSINGVRYPFTFVTTVYAGKPTNGEGEFYIQGVENTVKYMVKKLDDSVDISGRNISFDRLYTSILFG